MVSFCCWGVGRLKLADGAGNTNETASRLGLHIEALHNLSGALAESIVQIMIDGMQVLGLTVDAA